MNKTNKINYSKNKSGRTTNGEKYNWFVNYYDLHELCIQ